MNLKNIATRLTWRLADSSIPIIRGIGWDILDFARRRRPSADQNAAQPVPARFAPSAVAEAVTAPAAVEATVKDAVSPEDASFHNQPFADPERQRRERLLLISPSLPRYDRTSSSLRISHIVDMLASYFKETVFLYSIKTRDDLRYARRLPDNVRPKFVPLNAKYYMEELRRTRYDVLWMTDLFDSRYIEQCVEMLGELRALADRPLVITDTMDCHFQKSLRMAQTKQNPGSAPASEKLHSLESALYSSSDRLIVVTPNESKAIRQHFPSAPRITVLPNVHRLADHLPDFSSTAGLVFVGSAGVNHNRDAVLAFHAHVLPILKKQVPTVRLDVIGSSWEPFRDTLDDPAVTLKGWIGDLDDALTRYRALICPLLYGTGLKGKLGSAASLGVPIVTTSIGAEGFPVEDGAHCFIADSAEKFSEKTVQLLSDRRTWERFQRRFYGLMAERYSPRAVSIAVRKLMDSLHT